MLYKSLIVALGFVSASGLLFTENKEMQMYMWKSFKEEHRKSYDNVEEPKRFAVFIENLKLIDERNRLEGGSAVHGITKFADLSQEEFAAAYLKSVPDRGLSAGKDYLMDVPSNGATSQDWTGIYTTPVRDQGRCGSCWAFSATEQIESDVMRTQGQTYVLSVEQVTQCTTLAFGCDGGWTESAYKYVKNAGGIGKDSDYPYTSYYGVTGTCDIKSVPFVAGVTGYTTISGETNMANYVLSTGPLSICVDASNWSSYTGGILKVCGTSINHCVQAVGVDTTSAWKVRNSWGLGWGESGYIRLQYGSNTCGLTSDPTYSSVKLV